MKTLEDMWNDPERAEKYKDIGKYYNLQKVKDLTIVWKTGWNYSQNIYVNNNISLELFLLLYN